MRALVFAALAVAAAHAHAYAQADGIRGTVFADTNGNGVMDRDERGVAGVVVAFDVMTFVVTDAHGEFTIDLQPTSDGIVWARVPDGFAPGPVWAASPRPPKAAPSYDLALRPLANPVRGPVTFVVAADSHIPTEAKFFGETDLATVAAAATALDPPPAFFTILGDITQGNQPAQFDAVDRALAVLDVPWVPVPGNHDWYDNGATWFHRYGPDNYSFDIANVHFVVWNMAMQPESIRAFLGAELARVPHTMTIVALTHAPPSEDVVETLRGLGVDYVLTGHAHSNRTVDHEGLIELNTEPLLMGGLDFTPAGYRVITIDGAGKLRSTHHASIDEPLVEVVAPARGQCVPVIGGELVVAAALDAAPARVTARLDCGAPIALAEAGGWSWHAQLPLLLAGTHSVTVGATTSSGAHAETSATFTVCTAEPAPAAGPDWPQLGGDASHAGTRAHELAPPLAQRWATPVGGHVITAPPVIARGVVYAAVSDLGDGDAGGVVALELATGAVRWRVATAKPLRGGIAIAGDTAIAAEVDGTVLGLDAATGAERWRYALSTGLASEAGALFGTPSVADGEVLVGHQRAVAAIDPHTGSPRWTSDPVPEGRDSESLAAIAAGGGLAVGVFNRRFGGFVAWDAASGAIAWKHEGEGAIGANASPVIAGDTVYVVDGTDTVSALDAATGETRWHVWLDEAGFAWGNATAGTPALAGGVLVVPTLYRDLVALDAAIGMELWRHAGTPTTIRTTHYRGADEAGFEGSPIITGRLVWAADTAGELTALDLRTGEVAWQTSLATPVLAGLAASGDWLIVASFDGTVRAFTPAPGVPPPEAARALPPPRSCSPPALPPRGCFDDARDPRGTALLAIIVALVTLRRRGGAWARRRR